MSYEKFYPGGWQSGESGGTPITPEALNHIENGIKQTYSDFAPAGYGLGDANNMQILVNWGGINDVAVKPGWYKVAFPLEGISNWTLRVDTDGTNIFQEYKCIYNGVELVTHRSKTVGGSWGEFEWDNPPMILGVEYRTTKRHKGKPVYALMLPGGTLARKTAFSIYLSDRNIAEFVDWRCGIGNIAPTPYDLHWWGLAIDIMYKPTAAAIYGFNNWEADCNNARFYLEYTKSTY